MASELVNSFNELDEDDSELELELDDEPVAVSSSEKRSARDCAALSDEIHRAESQAEEESGKKNKGGASSAT